MNINQTVHLISTLTLQINTEIFLAHTTPGPENCQKFKQQESATNEYK